MNKRKRAKIKTVEITFEAKVELKLKDTPYRLEEDMSLVNSLSLVQSEMLKKLPLLKKDHGLKYKLTETGIFRVDIAKQRKK